jgi:hypothetical protein
MGPALLLLSAVAVAQDTGDTGVTPTTTTPTTTTTTTTPPAETGDTGVDDPTLDLDQDGDGWTPRDGDCDDANEAASPGVPEVCYDQLDNNCDGLADEACDNAARLASLRGGGGCTGGTNIAGTQTAAALLLPFAWLARRRRSA